MNTQLSINGSVPQRLAQTRELMSREGIHALAGAVSRPAPVRIPAGLLAGAPVVVGFPWFGRHPDRDSGFCRRLGRQPLLGAGDQGTQGQRH